MLEGRIDLVVESVKYTYSKGDHYFIRKGERHSGKIYAGYADITFFNQKDQCKMKNGKNAEKMKEDRGDKE